MILCQEIAHVKPDAADTLRVFQRVLVVDAGLRLRLEVLVPRVAPKLYVRVPISYLKMICYRHEQIAEIKKARASRDLLRKVRVRGFRVLLVLRRGRDRVLKVRLNDLRQRLAAAELLHGAEILEGN